MCQTCANDSKTTVDYRGLYPLPIPLAFFVAHHLLEAGCNHLAKGVAFVWMLGKGVQVEGDLE
jgi:hypothetical protein